MYKPHSLVPRVTGVLPFKAERKVTQKSHTHVHYETVATKGNTCYILNEGDSQHFYSIRCQVKGQMKRLKV